MRVDLHNDIEVRRAIDPAAVTDNTAFVSQIIDLANAGAVEFAIATGSLADADATFTVLVEDGDAANLSDAAAVDDAYLEGTEAAASFTFAGDNSVKKIGYCGPKRYVRLTITPANNTGSATVGAVAVLHRQRKLPRA